MRKIIEYGALILAILSILLFVISSCGSVGALSGVRARLVFKVGYPGGNYDIDVELTEEETERLRSIFEGKDCEDLFSIPSCGFDGDVSIRFGSSVFSPAMDSCSGVRWGLTRYFDVTAEEIDYIHALFEKYGGFFPCI